MAILAFHNVDSKISIGANNYNPHKFIELCSTLKESGYIFTNVDDCIDCSADTRHLCLSFDDGYKSFMDHVFPYLIENSIPAIVFVTAGYIGKKNSWDYSGGLNPVEHFSFANIKELSEAGIEIGSHGYSHIDLTSMSERFIQLELEKSKKILEDTISKKIRYISYPFGRHNKKVEAIALELGYERGFSLISKKQDSIGFTLERRAVYFWDTPGSIITKTEKGFFSQIERLKEKTINYYSSGTVLLNRLLGRNIPKYY